MKTLQRGGVLPPLKRGVGGDFPARFRVTEIGADYVLGVLHDDLDVEYVRMYRLLKPAG